MARQRSYKGDSGVAVEGLSALNRSLRELSKEHQKDLKQVGLDVAEFVAADAAGLATLIGGVAKKTAPSIRPHGYTTGAGISIGGAGYPFAGGAEFGSLRYKQFHPWKGNGADAGYFLYPAIRQDLDRIEQAYEAGIDRVVRKVGLA